MTEYEKIETKLRLESRFKDGAGWFYWIAALSLINTMLVLFNSSWNFISGLGITQVIDITAYEFSEYFGKGIIYFALFINLVIIGIFYIIGKLALKKMKWAMIVGIVLYSIDALTFLIFTDYLSIAFHLFALYSIIKGLKACKELSALENIPVEPTDSNEDEVVKDKSIQ